MLDGDGAHVSSSAQDETAFGMNKLHSNIAGIQSLIHTHLVSLTIGSLVAVFLTSWSDDGLG